MAVAREGPFGTGVARAATRDRVAGWELTGAGEGSGGPAGADHEETEGAVEAVNEQRVGHEHSGTSFGLLVWYGVDMMAHGPR